MSLFRKSALSLAVASFAAVSLHAQEIDTFFDSGGPGFASHAGYNSGDLMLAFYSAADASGSGQGDLVFDIGHVGAFINATAGTTYSVAGFNGSTSAGQPPVGSGNAELTNGLTVAPGSSTYWTVFGDGAGNTLYVTGPSTGQMVASGADQSTAADDMDAIGHDAANNVGGVNDGAAYLSNSDVYNRLVPAGQIWIGGENPVNSTVVSGNSLTLWELTPGGSAVNLGTFTLSETSGVETLSFTASNHGQGQADSARLINISTRAQVGTGANILIPGFVIGGSGTETLLIRADGPALTQFGVPGALAQPSLALFDGTGIEVASNTGWSTSADPALVASTASSVGAFPLQSGSADCALIVSLPAGAYTVHVSGVGNSTGVALAEVYEVSSSGTRLVNLSTRAQVGTGANIIISGFVVSGGGSESLLVRGDGPALAQFGVPGALAQPSLTVFDGTGTALASNTGWGTNSAPSMVASAAASVGAFPLQSGSADSALIVNLSQGPYTMQISGKNGTTGVALAEVYEIPPSQ